MRGFDATAKGWPGSRGRPEQAAQASDVKRRGGAEVRVGCSGTAATCEARRAAPPGAPRFNRHSPPLAFDGLRWAGRGSRGSPSPSSQAVALN